MADLYLYCRNTCRCTVLTWQPIPPAQLTLSASFLLCMYQMSAEQQSTRIGRGYMGNRKTALMPGGLVSLTPEKSRPAIELAGYTYNNSRNGDMNGWGPVCLSVLIRSTRSSLGDGDMLKIPPWLANVVIHTYKIASYQWDKIHNHIAQCQGRRPLVVIKALPHFSTTSSVTQKR